MKICIFLFSAVLAGVLLTVWQRHVTPSSSAVRYSEPQRFIDSEIDPVLDALLKGRYRLSTIQDRYNDQLKAVYRRYGARCELLRVLSYQDDDRTVVSGCRTEKRNPRIMLFVPALMDLHSRLSGSGATNVEEAFETEFVIDIMHELDHLVNDPFYSGRPLLREEFLRCEESAWADTSDHTLAPLVELDHVALPVTREPFYIVWELSGRKADSALWREFIDKGIYKIE